MKFRLKVISKNNGTVQYLPQVKMGLFKKWEYLYKESSSDIYIRKYYGTSLDSQLEALRVIEEFKVQLYNEEERIWYLKL